MDINVAQKIAEYLNASPHMRKIQYDDGNILPMDGTLKRFSFNKRDCIGAFLTENEKFCFLLCDQKGDGVYRLQLYPYSGGSTLCEIRKISPDKDGKKALCWKYIPKKQDTENNHKRKALFRDLYNDSDEVTIPLPESENDASRFIKELIKLAKACLQVNNQEYGKNMQPSLRELFDKYRTENNHDSWRKNYKDVFNEIEEVRSGKELTDSFIKQIWTSRIFGPGSVGQGVMHSKQFDEFILPLTQVTKLIIEVPSPTSLDETHNIFRNAHFEWIPKALVNRLMAATNPQRYSSVVNNKYQLELRNWLNKEYNLNIPLSENWAEVNSATRSALVEQGIPDDDPFLLNTFIWHLVEKYVQGQDHKETKETENSGFEEKMIKNENKNIILYGPPGTGKTYNTVNKALKILAPDLDDENKADRVFLKAKYDEYVNQKRIRFVTFHQSFSYEDFVEGIQAEPTEAGMPNYLVKPGIFKQICDDARKEKNKRYVLIIDEINRGNISRIFGELITLIEESKREGQPEELSVTLPYSKEKFNVPANVYLIGTMNTADRSLMGLDIALRRRFVFEEMAPNTDKLEGIEVNGLDIREMLEVMNARIEVLLDRDRCIGHTYFLPLQKETTQNRLASIFERQIVPLLQEYFFDDWGRIRWVLNDHKKEREFQFIQEFNNDTKNLFGDDVAKEIQGMRWKLNKSAFENIQSYIGIISELYEAVTTIVSPGKRDDKRFADLAEDYIRNKLDNARENGEDSVTIRCGDILKELAQRESDQQWNQRAPTVSDAMHKLYKQQKFEGLETNIIYLPPKGKGNRLEINYIT